ncbi:hypothetical protein NEFER03_0977 [Nematocida sp. LUAm3]|nr:hypothetical protein NEFER03_0977 [Nematocida sp. LUAm3]KAI5175419.1 hypothetical protein NEFER02_1348 [Nematocida sp. LUAm2]KAI5177624.1 hypothetical protein NEFER01_0848 [Nematocida sp. LUAm1]
MFFNLIYSNVSYSVSKYKYISLLLCMQFVCMPAMCTVSPAVGRIVLCFLRGSQTVVNYRPNILHSSDAPFKVKNTDYKNNIETTTILMEQFKTIQDAQCNPPCINNDPIVHLQNKQHRKFSEILAVLKELGNQEGEQHSIELDPMNDYPTSSSLNLSIVQQDTDTSIPLYCLRTTQDGLKKDLIDPSNSGPTIYIIYKNMDTKYQMSVFLSETQEDSSSTKDNNTDQDDSSSTTKDSNTYKKFLPSTARSLNTCQDDSSSTTKNSNDQLLPKKTHVILKKLIDRRFSLPLENQKDLTDISFWEDSPISRMIANLIYKKTIPVDLVYSGDVEKITFHKNLILNPKNFFNIEIQAYDRTLQKIVNESISNQDIVMKPKHPFSIHSLHETTIPIQLHTEKLPNTDTVLVYEEAIDSPKNKK